jgi:hypothetical protein
MTGDNIQQLISLSALLIIALVFLLFLYWLVFTKQGRKYVMANRKANREIFLEKEKTKRLRLITKINSPKVLKEVLEILTDTIKGMFKPL